MGKLENQYQAKLKERLRKEFPGCVVTKLDPNDIQGIPDLLILHNQHWATLEAKKDAKAKHRPNQDYYVDKMNGMSFSAFIYPENEDEIIGKMHKRFNE